jgi:mannose-1-phosphate guanylyltransferase
MQTFALILAGGASYRLFPFNKVLSDLTGSGRTLLQQSFDRLAGVASPERIYAVTAESMRPAFAEQLLLAPAQILSDPARRSTWPAILWALAHIQKQDPEAIVAVVTADHVIPDSEAFRRGLSTAIAQAAASDAAALLGVTPGENPDEWRGFGSVRGGGTIVPAVQRIIDFEEKPSRERAAAMIQQGGWYWNAGMFVFRASVAERLQTRYQPAMATNYAYLRQAVSAGNTPVAATVFADFPAQIVHPVDPSRRVDNSIDYAIMTPLIQNKSAGAAGLLVTGALPVWKDLGQWTALRGTIPADRAGNIRLGDVELGGDVRECIVAADRGARLQVRGVQGLICAYSKGTLLVLPASDVDAVKALAQQALSEGAPSVIADFCEACVIDPGAGRVVARGLANLRIRLTQDGAMIDGLPET